MRNIQDYEKKYVDEPFEETMADIRRQCVIEQMGETWDKHILEVGCGMHPLFLDVPEFSSMTIVEPSHDFATHAQELSELKHDREIRVVEGFLEEEAPGLIADGQEFDIIVCSSLLHELESLEKLLLALYSVCSSRTILHINVPNAKSLHRLIAYECGMISTIYERSAQQIKMQRYGTYDMAALVNDVEKAGFEIVKRGSYFIKPFTHAQMQRCLDEGIISEQVLTGLARVSKYLPEFGADIFVNVKRKKDE